MATRVLHPSAEHPVVGAVLGRQGHHIAMTHLFAGSAAILRPSDFIELAFLTRSAGSAAP